MNKFSLLICVYAKEKPEYFSQCLDSILKQTVMPDELVIVKDGPLTEELDAIIESLQFSGELSIIALPENVTLGPARAAGVNAAKHDWLAIMDTDDICIPERFEKQLNMIEKNPELGLIGGQISEFSDNIDNSNANRTVPSGHEDIVNFAKKRNPFNHMTVMVRRGLVLEAGSYRFFPGFEDYDLWTRMIKNGVVCANLQEILVHARADRGMYGRRRGRSYIKSEWRMQTQLKKLGLINGFEFLRNVVARIPIRLLPGRWLAAVYNRFARGQIR